MADSLRLRRQLILKTDLDWFDSICDLLKKESDPATHKLEIIIGTEKLNPKNEIRGSKFLDTYDGRFSRAYISPGLTSDQPDQPLDFLGFRGDTFQIRIGDIMERFKHYKTVTNTYDGGTQIFFYPVPKAYEFTAIDCWTEKENNEISDLADLKVNDIAFRFGNNLIQGRDGYSMKRANTSGTHRSFPT